MQEWQVLAPRHWLMTASATSSAPGGKHKHIQTLALLARTHNALSQRLNNGARDVHQLAWRQHVAQHGAKPPQRGKRLLHHLRRVNIFWGASKP